MTTVDAVQIAQDHATELKQRYLELERLAAEAKAEWDQRLTTARKEWHRARDEVAVVAARIRQLEGG